jgi:hypothetical protein
MPLPREPWLDCEPAKAIGPIERVHGPASRQFATVVWWVFVIGFAPGCLGMFCLVPCAHPRWQPPSTPPEFSYSILALLFAWVALACWSIYWGIRRLRWRLLVGQKGLALWEPGGATIVRWDDLGTLWHRSLIDPGLPSDTTASLVLVARDQRLIISRYFAAHELVIARVLGELHRRIVSPVEWRKEPRPGPGSDGITPPERGVAEEEG